MRLHYEIKGMSCAACVSHVERAVRSVIKDEDSATVSLLTNSVSIITREEVNREAFEEKLAAAISHAGYTLLRGESEKTDQNKEYR